MGGARCNCRDPACEWNDWPTGATNTIKFSCTLYNDVTRALIIEDMRKVLKALLQEQEKAIEKCYWCETPRSYEEPCKQCGRP